MGLHSTRCATVSMALVDPRPRAASLGRGQWAPVVLGKGAQVVRYLMPSGSLSCQGAGRCSTVIALTASGGGGSPYSPLRRKVSGDQWSITWRDQVTTVGRVGGGLGEYQVDGHPVLDGDGVGEISSAARGQPADSWPNRLRDERYTLNCEHQLPLTEPEKHNAIHGLARSSSWGRATWNPLD